MTIALSMAKAQESEIEGLDTQGESWGDFPIDDVLIRGEGRTIFDVMRRIDQGIYVMDPNFQRDFGWPKDRQSKLIESIVMRIPLPAFYLAEDNQGRMIVVDGLQRLSTFHLFVKDKFQLRLPGQNELNGKRFTELQPKFQNRIENCNLIYYIIDSKVPDRVQLDILERVNSGEPLTRQQMRNSLCMGRATYFLKTESQTETFLEATGGSLNRKTMRDRELVNRFCAFQLLDLTDYNADMDAYLASALRKMNSGDEMTLNEMAKLSEDFRRCLANNYFLFGQYAFRRRIVEAGDDPTIGKGMLNAALWDVMSSGLSRYSQEQVRVQAGKLRGAVRQLLGKDEFIAAITSGTNDVRKVRCRFEMMEKVLQENLGAHAS